MLLSFDSFPFSLCESVGRIVSLIFLIFVFEEALLGIALSSLSLHHLGMMLNLSVKSSEMIILVVLDEIGENIDSLLPVQLEGVGSLIVNVVLRRR
jgi:hypothetical protein